MMPLSSSTCAARPIASPRSIVPCWTSRASVSSSVNELALGLGLGPSRVRTGHSGESRPCYCFLSSLYSQKSPDKGETLVVESKLVQQVWQDFAPSREQG
jgi:hypothetical protein